jgi:endonuclease/exonuclease/phosphatase family metal-dependent hydrolase
VTPNVVVMGDFNCEVKAQPWAVKAFIFVPSYRFHK